MLKPAVVTVGTYTVAASCGFDRHEKDGTLVKRLVEKRNGKNSGLFDSLGRASTMGLHLVSGLLVGGLIGYWLDEWLGTGPWLKIVFFLVGVAAGFRNLYLDTKLLMKAQDADKDGDKSEKED